MKATMPVTAHRCPTSPATATLRGVRVPRTLGALAAFAALAALTACGGGGDGTRDAAAVPTTPAERVAAWRTERPGQPLPATVAFGDVLAEDSVAAWLGRHHVRPRQAWVRLGEVVGAVPLEGTADAAALTAAVREVALEAARGGLCGAVARIRGMYGEGETTLTLPGGDLGRAQAVLAAARAGLAQLEAIPAGTPLVWALQVEGTPDAVAAAGADPLVRAFLPAAMEPVQGERRALVPDPVPPASWDTATQTAGDDSTEADVRRGFDAVLRAARTRCPAAAR